MNNFNRLRIASPDKHIAKEVAYRLCFEVGNRQERLHWVDMATTLLPESVLDAYPVSF